MIFDDVEDATMLGNYWPKGALGSIVLTTRNPDVAKTCARCRLEVPLFTREESEEFLFFLNSNVDQNDAFEKSAVTKIAHEVDGLPLILNLVASHTSSIASSYHTFLQDYAEIDRDFEFRSFDSCLRGLTVYQKCVDTTWLIELRNMQPNARMLMETLAFLDKDGVPLAFFGDIPTDCK